MPLIAKAKEINAWTDRGRVYIVCYKLQMGWSIEKYVYMYCVLLWVLELLVIQHRICRQRRTAYSYIHGLFIR